MNGPIVPLFGVSRSGPRGRPRLLCLCALLAVAVAPAVVWGAAAAADTGVAVSPDTGLTDGQQVSVTLTGLGAETDYTVQECRGSDLTTCDPSTSRSVQTDSSGGASIPDFTITRLVSFGDCLMETCVIAATGGLEATPPNAPIDFAAVLSVSPNMGLADPASVTVSGDHFTALATYTIAQCTGAGCDETNTLQVTADENRWLPATAFTVHRVITVSSQAVDCSVTQCAVEALGHEAPAPSAPVTFAPVQPPQLWVMLQPPLVDGQMVDVSGSNFTANEPYSIEECWGTPVTPATCDPTTAAPRTAQSDGTLAHFGYSLKQHITVGGNAIDCANPGCVVAALHGTDANPPTVPFQFSSGPPPSGMLHVSQTSGLSDLQVVTVWGSNLRFNTTYSLQQCTPQGCDSSTAVAAPTNGFGAFPSTGFTVHRSIMVGGISVDCRTTTCVIAATGGGEQTPPYATIQFATAPPPTPGPGGLVIGVRTETGIGPASGLHDLDTIVVSGGGNASTIVQPNTQYWLFECASIQTPSGPTLVCDPTTSGPRDQNGVLVGVTTNDAGFMGTDHFVVHRMINNGTTDCMSVQCVVVMGDANLVPVTGPAQVWFAGSTLQPAAVVGTVSLCVQRDANGTCTAWGKSSKIFDANHNVDPRYTTLVLLCPGTTPGCSQPTVLGLNINDVYGTNQLPALGGSYDVQAVQLDVSQYPNFKVLRTSAHYSFTPSPGGVEVKDFVLSDCLAGQTCPAPAVGEFLVGKVTDKDGNVLPASPYGGGGTPLTGVAICPYPQTYQTDPSAACNGGNVRLAPTDATGRYRVWVPAGDWNVTAFSFLAPPGSVLNVYKEQPIAAVDPELNLVVDTSATLTYTGPTAVLPGASVTLSGSVADHGVPVADQHLLLSLGSQSCKAWTDPTGVATCDVTLAQPAGTVQGTAAFAVDPTYRPSVPVDVTIGQSQTITFGTLGDRTYGDPPFVVAATATSDLPVGFTSDTPTVCTVSVSTVTILRTGTCTIRATQPGNAAYLPAPAVTRSFTVRQAVPVVTWAPTPASILFGAPLVAGQLHASAALGPTAVPGTFTYLVTSGPLPAGTPLTVGMVLQPGAYVAQARFTPTDTTDFTAATKVATITVGFSRACITTRTSGALTVLRGQAICIGPGGQVSGAVTVQPGGSLWISGGTVGGAITSTGAAAVTIGGATIGGSLTITGSTGPVNLGGPACGSYGGNRIGGSATITNNRGGVTFVGNRAGGALTITNNTGGFVYSGNTAGGRTTVTNNH